MTTETLLSVRNGVRPKKRAVLSYLLKARRDQPNLLYRLAQEYGNMVHLQLGSQTIFFVTGPVGVEHVLQSNQHNYRGFNYSHVKLRPLLGNGLLTSEGELWLKHRRLAQQAFHKEQMEQVSRLMVVTIQDFLARWQARVDSQAVQDIGAEMGLLTLAVVCESLFGTRIGERAAYVRDAWPQVLDHLVKRMVNPLHLPENIPVHGNRQYRQSLDLLNETIYSLISDYRTTEQETGNLLGMLIAAHHGELDTHLDDQELRDEVMTILLAGHETCANALTWTFYLLAQHPEIQERLAEEVSGALDGRVPGYQDLANLPYTAMVFNEALRLYPPAWIMARDVLEDDVIEGYAVPAGSSVFLSPYVTHRLSEFWPDPLRFDPLRFSPERAQDRPRFAYFPFGGGQRQCLGKNFALIEARLAIPLIIQRYRFSIAETAAPGMGLAAEPLPTYNMRPDRNIWLRLEKR